MNFTNPALTTFRNNNPVYWYQPKFVLVTPCASFNVGTRDRIAIIGPNGSRETILAKLPRRTWKAIAHQPYNQGWHRGPDLSNRTPRRRWEADEERSAQKLYKAGTPVPDIASKLGRSYSAVLQRAWEKGWQRPHSDQRMAVTEFSGTNQNPEVSKRITSGLVFGGQVKTVKGEAAYCQVYA